MNMIQPLNTHLYTVQCADAQAVLAGSPPEKKSFQAAWLSDWRRTAGTRAERGRELSRKRKVVRKETFWMLFVTLNLQSGQPAAFSNTPSTLSTPLSSGSRWGATSHCTLHLSICRSVSFKQAFHFSAACTQSEEASCWSAASYRIWKDTRRELKIKIKMLLDCKNNTSLQCESNTGHLNLIML